MTARDLTAKERRDRRDFWSSSLCSLRSLAVKKIPSEKSWTPPGRRPSLSKGGIGIDQGQSDCAANSRHAFESSRSRSGNSASKSSIVSPAARYSSIDSTGYRRWRMAGLPWQIAGSIVMRDGSSLITRSSYSAGHGSAKGFCLGIILSLVLGILGVSGFETAALAASTQPLTFGVVVPEVALGKTVAQVTMQAPESVVMSLDLRLTYDPAAASVLEVKLGALVSRMSSAINTNQAGIIRAALAGASAISGEGSVLEIAVQATQRPQIQLAEALVNEGTIASRIQRKLRLAGKVRYYARGAVIPNVSMNLSGSKTESKTGGNDGSFEFNVDADGSYSLSPAKTTDSSTDNGIDVLDIVLIRRDIFGVGRFDSPFKFLAADVTGDCDVDVLDIVHLRRLIFGLSSSFPAGLWKFVRSDHVFSDLRPCSVPSARSRTGLSTDFDGDDFVGIKLGDVSGDWSPPVGPLNAQLGPGRQLSLMSSGGAGPPRVTFRMTDGVAAPGSRVKAPVTVTGFKQVTGAQFTVQWDPAVLRFVQISGLNLAGLGSENFGTALAEQGKIAVVWDDPRTAGVSLPDETAIFALEFQTVGPAGKESVLALADAPTRRRVVVGTAFGQFVTEHGLVRVETPEPPLTISLLRDNPRAENSLVFRTGKGKTYIVEYADSLSEATVWRVLGEVTGDGSEKVVKDPNVSDHQRFYRVRVR